MKKHSKKLTVKEKIELLPQYIQIEWERGSAVFLWFIWICVFFFIVSGAQKYTVLPLFPYKILGYVLLLFVPIIMYKMIRMFMTAPREGKVYLWGIIPIGKPLLYVLGSISVCFFILLMAVPLVFILRGN